MDIGRVRTDSLLLEQATLTKRLERLSVRLSSGRQLEIAGEDPLRWQQAAVQRERLTQLSAVHDQLNAVGVSFRAIDQSVQALDKYLELLQREIEAIRDSAPPAAAERAQHAARYNELRQQMDDLVNGQQDELARTLTGDPGVVKGAGNVEILIGENSLRRLIPSQELHTGPNGLNITAMPANATAQDAIDAAAEIVAARAQLTGRAATFAQRAAELVRLREQGDTLSSRLTARAESLEMADLDATGAALQSLQVQQTLLMNTGHITHELQSALLSIIA